MSFYFPSTITPLFRLCFSCVVHNLKLGQGPSGSMTFVILRCYSPFLGSIFSWTHFQGNNSHFPFLGEHSFRGLVPEGRIPTPHSQGSILSGTYFWVESLLPILGGVYFLWPHSCGQNSSSPFLESILSEAPFLGEESMLPIPGGAYFLGPYSWGYNPYSPFLEEHTFWGLFLDRFSTPLSWGE